MPDYKILFSNGVFKYIFSAVMLYLLFIVFYLVRERRQKRKQNAAKKSVFNPFRFVQKEDIIGKSKFDLRHSLPQATTLKKSEKGIENSDTFAGETIKKASKAIPLDQLDAVFSNNNSSDEYLDEINLVIENTPPEFEPEENDEELDDFDEEDTEGVAGVSIALGLDFNDLAGMLRTVDNDEKATAEQKEEAGRVLVEIRMTDMFEQVVSGEPKKKAVVTSLMDEYFSAFHRKQREASEATELTVKAPKDFDIRSFA